MNDRKLPLISFYTKQQCRLCDEAKRVIESVMSDIPCAFNEIDITSDAEIYDTYIEQIPVVYINDEKSFVHFVDEQKLREKLQQCM